MPIPEGSEIRCLAVFELGATKTWNLVSLILDKLVPT